MWLLLVPILLIVLLMFVMGSVVAGLFWIVGSAWPLLLIALGAWLFWHEDGRHHRGRHAGESVWRRRGRPAPRPSPVAAPPRDARPAAPTTSSASPRVAELPIDMQVKVEQIRRKAEVLLGYADRFPPFSQDLYLVRQTTTDYLPRTINAYLGLSRQAVDQPLKTGGKTAREELKAQLELLDSKLDDIAQDLQRQDADRLLANRRFLESRFGARDAERSTQAPSAADVA